MSAKHIDKEAMLTLKEIMEDEFASLIETFLHDAQANIKNLTVSIEHKDEEDLRYVAHALKGSAANITALYLSQLAAELEQKAKLMPGDFDAYLPMIKAIEEEFELLKPTLMLEVV